MNNKQLILLSVLLGLIFIIGITIFSYALYISRLPQRTLTVTGSSREKVDSDVARWVANFSVRTTEDQLREAFSVLKDSESKVISVYEKYGFKKENLKILPVVTEDLYTQEFGQPRSYVLRQNIILESSDVQKIAEVSKSITQELLDMGIVFQTYGVEYYYSKLAEKRVELLSKAMDDAYRRANEIARSGGLKIEKIITARSGVVQVIQPNTVDISDYGTYDTSTIEKEIMVTVNVVYGVR